MNKFIYTLLTMISLSCMTANANAFTNYQCGEWLNAKKLGENSPEYAYMMSWFLSYMSGLAIGPKKDILKNAKTDSVVSWVDNFCSANPLNSLYSASTELIRDLAKQ